MFQAMNAWLMVACIFLTLALLKVSLFLSVCCLGGVFYFGSQLKTSDESRLFGVLGLLALVGIVTAWLT